MTRMEWDMSGDALPIYILLVKLKQFQFYEEPDKHTEHVRIHIFY